ncbi:MAG TPA: SDR family NAD(P)-dependent oxidoreductase [Bacteroidetes bacterium]|nr:SDR family NAD(P)-dependent oxidoreductase [Bacteroidota bacterium]
MKLKNSRILITGGSSGLGKAMAVALVEQGANVVITGRDKEKLEKVANDIGCTALHFDVGNYDSIAENAAKAIELLGGLDVLINNAGIGEFALVDELTVDQFEKIFTTNVFGLAMLSQEVIKYFKIQNKGNIINIGSTAAAKGFAYGTVYAASKFALRGMTECWQAELRKHNIRVMLVNPSEVPTAFNVSDRAEKADEPKKLTPVEIAHSIVSVLSMDDRGFIPELAVWATNPF